MLYDYFRRTRKLRPWAAGLWALFLVFASDMVSVSLDGGVWYQAQTLNFLLLVSAFAAMARKRPTLACLFYALAVGCRPFTVLFGPVLLMMYLQQKKRPRLWPGLAAGLCVAACYAAYNYARFGNVFEFGHNYLPEFTRVETGQFSLAYVAGNVKTFLFGLPFSVQNGAWTLNKFGFSMFLCNPALWMAAVWLVEAAVRRRFRPQMLLVWLLMLLHLFCLFLHKSFGGFQFGARYTLELIPYAAAMLHFSPRRAPRAWEVAVLFAGADLQRRGRVSAQLLRAFSRSRAYLRCVAMPPRRCRSRRFFSNTALTSAKRPGSMSLRRQRMSLWMVVLLTPKRSAHWRTVAPVASMCRAAPVTRR